MVIEAIAFLAVYRLTVQTHLFSLIVFMCDIFWYEWTCMTELREVDIWR